MLRAISLQINVNKTIKRVEGGGGVEWCGTSTGAKGSRYSIKLCKRYFEGHHWGGPIPP
jgi:hypothetical protein